MKLFLIGAWSFFGAWNLQLGASDTSATSPASLGSWLLSAAAALSIMALGKQFMRKTPLEAEFLTKREFQDFKDKDFAEFRQRVDQSFHDVSEQLKAMNNRLSDIGALVARLDERTKLHSISHHPSTIDGKGV
jgi:oligoendopeptidase F